MTIKTFKETPTTLVCQLNKPENRVMLEGYIHRKNYSPKELANFCRDLVKALKGTPAWGISGCNRIVNDAWEAARAVLDKGKDSKVSAPDIANKLLGTVDRYKDQKCTNTRGTKYYKTDWLVPALTEEELLQLEVMA